MTFDPLAERPWKGISYLVLEPAGVVVQPSGVRIPYREPAGSGRYWRVKRADGREWFEPKPSRRGGLIPLGVETLSLEAERDELSGACLFVTEGESDALALREAFAEWSLFPRGVFVIALPGAGSWRREWRTYLERFETIFVIPDGDPAGDRMARAVRRDLRWTRLVMLPEGDDARSIVQAGGGGALVPHLEDADRRFRVEAALRLSDPDPAHALSSFLRAFEERR